jgi:ribose 5-phosphate isomerase B
MALRIAVGADHAGFALTQVLVERLRGAGHEVVDLGTTSEESVDYPVYAHAVAVKVATGEVERGLLVCGTGLGMCIAANRHAGVRAADCVTVAMADMARRHNDSNLLCLGARLLDEAQASTILEAWLTTPFEGARHERRVAQIDDLAPAAER